MQINSLSFCIPTYNRAILLGELLKSIKISFNNIDKKIDYEILICDDGSSDETFEVVRKFQLNNPSLSLIYFFQKNQGRASSLINLINNTNKKYLMIMDDDDLIPPLFFIELNKINSHLRKYKLNEFNSNNISGIAFLCLDDQNRIIGNKFKKNYLLSNFFNVIIYDKKKGDAGEILNVKELKKNLYSINTNEKRASTGLLHLSLSKNNDFIFINKALKIKRYFDDGLSNNLLFYKTTSPNYSLAYEKLLLEFQLPLIYQIRCFININRYYFHGAKKVKFSFFHQLMIDFFYFISLLLYTIDRLRLRNNKLK